MLVDVLEVLKTGFSWFKYFNGLELVVPFLAASTAAWWLQRKFNHQVALLTGELRSAARAFDRSVKDTIKQVEPEFVAAAGVIDVKREQLKNAMAEYSAQAAAPAGGAIDASGTDTDEAGEEETRWAEMQAIWRDVKEWLDELLAEAITRETRGRANKLAAVRKTDYDDVIIHLFNYGWLRDPEIDIALEMSGIYKQHRNRRIPVSASALRRYRRMSDRWLKS